jgi:cytochrome c553
LPAGNVETGATKAVVCQACHGANGNSVNPEWPSLAGLGADYIAEQLQNFKDGKRANPVMMPMAMSAERRGHGGSRRLLRQLGQHRPRSGSRPIGRPAKSSIAAATRRRGIPACMACHGPTGRGNEPAKFPALRGQQSVYVSSS